MIIDNQPPEKGQCCQQNQPEQPGAPVGFREAFLVGWLVDWLLSCFHRLPCSIDLPKETMISQYRVRVSNIRAKIREPHPFPWFVQL